MGAANTFAQDSATIHAGEEYKWLENENSSEVKEWLSEQHKILKKEEKRWWLTAADVSQSISRWGLQYGALTLREGPYFIRNIGYRKLAYKAFTAGKWEDAFDCAEFRATDTMIITAYALSEDSNFLGVVVSTPNGSDKEIRVRNLNSHLNIADVLEGVQFDEIAWWRNGFFYTKKSVGVDATATIAQIYYHRLHDKQSQDQFIADIPKDAMELFWMQKTFSSDYLVVCTTIKKQGKIQKLYASLKLNEALDADFQPFFLVPDSGYVRCRLVDFINGRILMSTNFNADKWRVLAFNPGKINDAIPIIPEFNETLVSISHIFHKLVGLYFNDGQFKAYTFNYDGKVLTHFNFERGITINGFYGWPYDSLAYFSQQSLFSQAWWGFIDLKENKQKMLDQMISGLDVTKYTTELVHYKTSDSTEVLMYLAYKKGLKRGVPYPTIMIYHGQFRPSLVPYYSFLYQLAMENSAIIALPVVRGATIRGEEWYRAGVGANKQHSVDDFIAAADYLIKEGFTSKDRLAFFGYGANGGVMGGAVMNQRPELFKAVVTWHGVFDIEHLGIKNADHDIMAEYGRLTDSHQLNTALKYSPLHNVKKDKSYPSTLCVSSVRSPVFEQFAEVAPYHTFKFVNALQRNSSNLNPHLLFFYDSSNVYYASSLGLAMAFTFDAMHLPLYCPQ